MPAVIEFGFDSKTVFSGMDELDRRLRKQDTSVASSQAKLASALRNPWVSAGVDVQKYGAELVRAEKQARLLAAQTAKMASMRVTGVGYKAASNPWGTAGASQYAAQQDAAKQAAAAAAMLDSQQRAAMAAAAAQQKVAAANALTQQKAQAAAAASAALASAEQRKAALQTNNGRMNLALIEAQIAGNKKEAAGIEARINLLERMRTIQAQTNVSQREAYTLAQRSAGISMLGGGGKGGARLGIGMAAMQMQDIAVQMQMGTKMSTIIAQQGSQLLSVFGPGGMILGGLVAVGGMLYSVQQAGVEALKALKEEAGGFDQSLRKLKTGGIMDMIDGMEKMKEKADEMKDAADSTPGALKRFFSPSRLDSKTGKWVNSADEKQQVSSELVTKNEQGRRELMDQIVKSSEEELRISQMRADNSDAEADKLEREVAKRRELARLDAAPAEVRDKLKSNVIAKYANEQKKADADEARKKQDEMKRVADAQKNLDERKLQASLEEMDLAKRIATLNAEAQKALAEEGRLKAGAKRDDQAIIDAASRSLEINRERNRLQRQYTDDKAREAKEAERESKRRAEEVQQAGKEASQRRSSVMDTAMEYKLLKAKVQGNSQAIEQAEYEQRVLEKTSRYQDRNGMDRGKAMALAMKMTDLEDRADGKRTRIRGVQNIDADPNNRFGLSGHNGPLAQVGPLSKGGPLSKQGGLAGFWNMQMGNAGQMGTDPSEYMLKNTFSSSQSLQATHAENAAKEVSTGSPMVDTFIEKIITRLPPALAAAILADT